MKLIGLTGGIASGKTEIARLLAAHGAAVIDADRIAREVVEPGTPALAEIGAAWPQAMRPDGTLDRPVLGRLVFSDRTERSRLDAIVMPRIVEQFIERSQALARSGTDVAIFDAALIVENGLDRGLDGLIVVSVPPELQVARLRSRDGLPEEEARARIAAQLPLETKLTHARWVIDNTGTLEETRRQVDLIWDEIRSLP